MRTSSLAFVMGVGLAACGGGAPEPNVAPGPNLEPIAAKPVKDVRRGPSKALLERWPLQATTMALYADTQGLLATPLAVEIGRVSSAVMGTLGAPAGATECAAAVLSAKEIAFGASAEGRVVLARVDAKTEAAAKSCAALPAGEATSTTIPGATSAWLVGSGRQEVLAIGGEILAVGPKEVVVAVFGGKASGGGTLASMRLGADEYVTFAGELPDDAGRVSGALVVLPERTRLGAKIVLREEARAKQLETMLSLGRRQFANPGDDGERMAGKLLEGVTIERHGSTLDAGFEMAGTPAKQAEDIGKLATLSVFAVRRYIANAKTAEAKNAVSQIARSVVAEWEMERMGPNGKVVRRTKLASYPAVPKTVPKGTKAQTTPDDWKPWAELRFEMSAPQYFQYEVKAAKDGQSAEVLAHGDLNGDGKTSTFRLPVKVEKGAVRIAPVIEEVDPLE